MADRSFLQRLRADYAYELKLALALLLVGLAVVARLQSVNNSEGVTTGTARTIHAPADRIWPLIVSPDNRPRWTTGLLSVDVLTGDPDAIGSRFLAFHQIGRDRWQVDERLEVLEPDRRWVVSQTSEDATTRLEIALSPIGDNSTRVTIRAARRYTDPWNRFFNFWLIGTYEEQLESSLETLDDLMAEAGGS